MSNVVPYEVHVYIWTNFSTSKVKRKCIKLSFICRQCLYDKEMAAIIQKGKIKQEILTVAKCIFLSANYIDIFFVIIYFLLEHEPVIYKIFMLSNFSMISVNNFQFFMSCNTKLYYTYSKIIRKIDLEILCNSILCIFCILCILPYVIFYLV